MGEGLKRSQLKNFKYAFFVSLLALYGLLSSPALADSGFLTKIPLEWMPTNKIGEWTPVVGKKPVIGKAYKIGALQPEKKENNRKPDSLATDPDLAFASVLAEAKKVKFTVAPFTDLRETPEKIGEKVYSKSYTQKVTTKDSVAVWLTDRVADVLGQFGMGAVKSDATVNLEADIVRFYVVEKTILVPIYDGNVELHWRLKATNGDVLWEGTTHGEVHRGWAVHKAEFYMKALSDSVLEAMDNLMKTEAFLTALKNTSSEASN